MIHAGVYLAGFLLGPHSPTEGLLKEQVSS